MATIKPFQPYRYSPSAGDPSTLLTQPYDKINASMQARYLAANPYNLVRIILGERKESDTDSDNIYTRSAQYLEDWIRSRVLVQDAVPALYAYFQEFEIPDSGERATRQGFIGIGKVEDYSAGIVHRHEQTLSGPKKDRLDLLRHTRAHYGQIFMLYPDPAGEIDKLLLNAAKGVPVMDVKDDYGARHRLWPIAAPGEVARIQELMQPKKLLIADGHHRYETALAYRNENPEDSAADYVMMTFVNMHSPGLRILASHRVVRNLGSFDAHAFFEKAAAAGWSVTAFDSPKALKHRMASHDPHSVKIGVVTAHESRLIKRHRVEGDLDVPALHTEILGRMLGIDEDAVQGEKNLEYVRGMDSAIAAVREHGAEAAFLLDPTPIEDMARIAFAGGVMPQKSTDFYPKLLSGVTIYKL